MGSDIRLLGDLKGVIDLDSQIAHRAFKLRVSKEKLHSA